MAAPAQEQVQPPQTRRGRDTLQIEPRVGGLIPRGWVIDPNSRAEQAKKHKQWR